MGAGAAGPAWPNTEGVAGTDCGAAAASGGFGANTTGAGAAGGWTGGVGAGACGMVGIGALARCCANTRVGGGDTTGGRPAARRAAMVGSLSRSNSASMPWNTSWHWPQRTQPSETLSWSCTTRKIVPQAGQRVARLMPESYDATRAMPGRRSKGSHTPPGMRSSPGVTADQAVLRPVIKIHPSTVSATSSAIQGA